MAVSVDIDSLNIQVQAGADDAVNNINALSRSLKGLKNAYNSIPAKVSTVIKANSKLISSKTQLTKSNTQLASANAKTGKSFSLLGSGAAGAIAKLGFGVFTAKRVGEAIGGLITQSNDYQENLNLFTVSMRGATQSSLDYANAVEAALGIDPSEWIRYQAVFQNMATGFGISADKAEIMSRNLVQMGYDLGSVFNKDFDTAMYKLEAALGGQPRPMREWGFDMSEASLKSIALAKGIKKNVELMTQAEKAQLRYILLWETMNKQGLTGDFARTLEAPANQLRILSNQAKVAARELGNIFIPFLNIALPYAIAVVKVVRMVASAIASLFGFQLTDIDYSGLSGATSTAGDLSDELDSASGSAKKLKDQLAGFDEINIIQSESGGGSGSGGSGGSGSSFDLDLPDTSDWLDGAIATRYGKIVDEWWGNLCSWVEKFKAAAEPTIAAAQRLMEALKPVGDFAWQGLRDFYEYGLKPIGLWVLGEGLPSLMDIISTVAESVNWSVLTESVRSFYSAISHFATSVVGDGFKWLVENVFAKAAEWALNDALPLALQTMAEVFNSSGWQKAGDVFKDIYNFFIKPAANFAGNKIIDTLNSIKKNANTASEAVAAIGGQLAALALSGQFMSSIETFKGALTTIKGILAAIAVVAITVSFTYKFTNDYLTTGDFSKLIADGLTTALGAAITGKVLPGALGSYAAGAIVAISALTTSYVIYKDTNANGFKGGTAVTAIVAAAKGAIAGGVIGQRLGLKSLEGASIGMTLSVFVSALAAFSGSVANDKNSLWEDVLSGVLLLASGGIGATTLAKALKFDNGLLGTWGIIGLTLTASIGATIITSKTVGDGKADWGTLMSSLSSVALAGIAGALLGGMLWIPPAEGAMIGIAIATFINAAIISIGVTKSKFVQPDWGDVQLSATEIEQAARDMFAFDVDAVINVIKGVISDEGNAKKMVNEKIVEFEADVNKIKLGVVVDNSDGTYTKLHDDLIGENGILANFQKMLDAENKTVALAVSIVPPVTKEGENLSANILKSMGLSNESINAAVQEVGKNLGDLLQKGMTEQLSNSETETVAKLTKWLADVTYASARGQATGEFVANMKILLADVNKESFSETLKAYNDLAKGLTDSLSDIEVKAYAALESNKARLELVEQYYRENGDIFKANEIAAQLEEVNKEIEKWDIDESLKIALDGATEKGRESVLAAFNKIFGGALQSVSDDGEIYSSTISMFLSDIFANASTKGIAITVAWQVEGILREALGKDYDDVMLNMPEKLNITGWDLLSADIQKELYDTLKESIGGDKTVEVLTALGYDLGNILGTSTKDGVESAKSGLVEIGNKVGTETGEAIKDSTIEAVKGINDEINEIPITTPTVDGSETVQSVSDTAKEAQNAFVIADEFGSEAKESAENVKENFIDLPEWFDMNVAQQFIIPVRKAFNDLSNEIWMMFYALFNNLNPIFAGASAQITIYFKTTYKDVTAIWQSAPDWFKSDVTDKIDEHFSVLAANIEDYFITLYPSISTNFISPMRLGFNDLSNSIYMTFNALVANIRQMFTSLASWMNTNVATDISARFKKNLNDVIKDINTVIGRLNRVKVNIPKITVFGETFGGGTFNLFSINPVSMMAAGGMVDKGQLFIARESGPELVGSMSGRTTVANNDQIVQGIAAGVANANAEQNALLRRQNALLQAILEKEAGVTISPSAALGKVVKRSQALYAQTAGGV